MGPPAVRPRAGTAPPGPSRPGRKRGSGSGLFTRSAPAWLPEMSDLACIDLGVQAPEIEAPEAGSSLLAYYHQSDPAQDSSEVPTRCPHRLGFYMLNEVSGQSYPQRCGRVTCTYCVHYLALHRSAAIAYSRPQRAILLTRVGRSWPEGQRRILNTRRNLRRMGVDPGEQVAHLEWDPSGDGYLHAHLWQHGERPIPVRKLSAAAEDAGCGFFARINRVRSVVGVSQYGLKGVAEMGYGLKGVEDLAAFLDANGGRLTHQTRGFFRSERGGTLSVRGAEDRAVAMYTGRTERIGSWRVVSESYLEALSVRAQSALEARSKK